MIILIMLWTKLCPTIAQLPKEKKNEKTVLPFKEALLQA